MDFSGSGSRVINENGKTNLAQQASSSKNRVLTSSRMTTGKDDQVHFSNEEEALSQMKAFRLENENDWLAYTYSNDRSNEIVFLGTGSRGVTELNEQLKDDNVVYALVRKIDQIDDSKTLKIAFIFWVGENINRMLRARLGTHKGAINSFFSPYHVDLNPTQHNEITDEMVMDSIRTASGSKVHVLDETQIVSPSKIVPKNTNPSTSSSFVNSSNEKQSTTVIGNRGISTSNRRSVNFGKSVSTDTIELNFENEDEIRKALADVHSDSNDNNWVIITYNAPTKSKTLKLAGIGSGGFDEFVTHLNDNEVGYGLVRLIEVVDQSSTIKFVFVNWVGDGINRMQRAMLATHKGFITNLFSPYHVAHDCNRKDEISEDILISKVKKAAGTADYVLKLNPN